jgi:hypothetical protein
MNFRHGGGIDFTSRESAFRLGQSQRAFERGETSADIARRSISQLLQHHDFDDTCSPPLRSAATWMWSRS